MADFELPEHPSGEQISGHEFPSARRGYDPDHVREYLRSLAARFESMQRELQEARRSIEEAQSQVSQGAGSDEGGPEQDPYEAFGKRVAGLLASADKEGARVLKEAKAEAHGVVEQARSDAAQIRAEADVYSDVTRAEADEILESAREEAERTVEGAREEADRTVASLAGRRRVLSGQLEAMQTRLLETAKTIDDILNETGSDEAPAPDEPDEQEEPETTSVEEDVDDPPPENLWASVNESDLPDFDGIEFDLDADDRPSQEN